MAVAAMCIMPVGAKTKKKELPKDTLIFTTVIEAPVTSIKNQNSSGTCWAYSSLAFLESEIIKKHPEMKDIDLCESFLVSKTYTDRADRHVRTHGDASFSQGGSFYDAIFCMKQYGLMPEGTMPYPITLYGDSLYNFGNFFPPMEAYVKAIAGSEKKINPAWKKNVQGMLDNYFGQCPTEFEYKGKKYTPQSFVKDYLNLDPNDYVSLTSYTHQPYYESFILEIQDNWRWAESYNLPLDEFMEVMDYGVRNGYCFAWGSDVSEKGFDARKGTATVPANGKTNDKTGSDAARWTGDNFKGGAVINTGNDEMTITQELRQIGYDNWETTDDHGMVVYGIAKDKNGKEFFMVKNSWGEYGPYKGMFYASKAFVAYKTMNIVIHKDALPKHIAKKLGL